MQLAYFWGLVVLNKISQVNEGRKEGLNSSIISAGFCIDSFLLVNIDLGIMSSFFFLHIFPRKSRALESFWEKKPFHVVIWYSHGPQFPELQVLAYISAIEIMLK